MDSGQGRKNVAAIGGATRCLGLVGKDIAYTLSPAMHNRAAHALKIDQVYLPFPMSEETVKNFIEVFWQVEGVGLNITTPFKKLVADFIRAKSGPSADVASSVNTLYRQPGSSFWSAASTDGEGFSLGLMRMGLRLTDLSEIIIIGSGGATLALLEYFKKAHSRLQKIWIFRRESAEGVKRDQKMHAVSAKQQQLRISPLNVAALTKALEKKGRTTLLVQATNAPLKGDDLKELVPALKDFGGCLADLVYGKPSALYFHALARDLTAQDGEAMLIEQARLSQKLWWGKAAAYEEMAAALRGK
jgi:shikimate 5-dehydrogenase